MATHELEASGSSSEMAAVGGGESDTTTADLPQHDTLVTLESLDATPTSADGSARALRHPMGGLELDPSWNAEQLSSHIRDVLGLPELAALFKTKRIDVKAASYIHREDFTEPPPSGFGLVEDGPELEKIWAFLVELRESVSQQSSVSVSGASSATTAPAGTAALHHPRSDAPTPSTPGSASSIPAGTTADPMAR